MINKTLVSIVGLAVIAAITIAATIGGPTLGPAPSSSGTATNVNITAFNQNQFESNANVIQIKSGSTETNKQFYTGVTLNTGVYTGDASGETNIQGTAFSSGTATLNNTNMNLVIGSIYQTLTLITNCNITNISGVGVVSLKLLPGVGNRTISFPTNWGWLNTNGFTLIGPLYSLTLSNGASKIGWFSAVTSGTDPTNVAAAYQQTP